MFNELKTAQASAFLIAKAGGKMHHIKLMKLLYLADRKSLEKYNNSISDDKYFSMKNGPILSHTLDLMNGERRHASSWESWISDKEDHQVGTNFVLQSEDSLDELDELSDNDLSILEEIYASFGHRDRWDLIDNYMHNPECIPEWKNPGSSSSPIALKTLLTYLNKNHETIESIEEQQRLSEDFSNLIIRNQ